MFLALYFYPLPPYRTLKTAQSTRLIFVSFILLLAVRSVERIAVKVQGKLVDSRAFEVRSRARNSLFVIAANRGGNTLFETKHSFSLSLSRGIGTIQRYIIQLATLSRGSVSPYIVVSSICFLLFERVLKSTA